MCVLCFVLFLFVCDLNMMYSDYFHWSDFVFSVIFVVQRAGSLSLSLVALSELL